MMQNKIMRLLTMLFVFVFIIFSSVAFSGEIKRLNNDKLPSKYQSVLFGRVRVLTSFPRFRPSGTGCFFALLDLQNMKQQKDFSIAFNYKNRLKVSQDGLNGYDASFVAGAEAGDYLLHYFVFKTPNNYRMTEFIANADENEYITGMSTLILKSFNIPPNSLVYMGVIEVDFVDARKISDHPLRIEFTTETEYTNDDFDADLRDFQKKYPKLYEQYKDNIVEVNWNDFKIRYVD